MKKIVYQVLPRLWGNGKMSSFDNSVLTGLKEFGIDYIWFTGIPRHASGKEFVKGDPGCPYSISDWRDVNPYLADDPEKRIEEFSALVARTHESGMKVCIDYIPNHVACDYQGPLPHFDWCDGDWTDTLKLNWNGEGIIEEMISILLYWKGLGVDAFRCDMVELVPSDKLGRVIAEVKKVYADTLFIAEVYEKGNYRRYLDEAYFDYLYDKSGSYDILRGIKEQSWSAEGLTWNWQWLSEIQPKMLNFLENHDEQRVAYWAKDSYWPGLAFSALYNTASFMIYFGEEIGEDASMSSNGRTSIFSWEDNPRLKKLKELYSGKEKLSRTEKDCFLRFRELLAYARKDAFSSGGVWDLCYLQNERFDRKNHFAFLRYTETEIYLVYCNFSSTEVNAEIMFPEELRCLYSGGPVSLSVPKLDYRIVNLSNNI